MTSYWHIENLSKYFEKLDLCLERRIFALMRWLPDDYAGEYGEYHELSTGGVSTSPVQPERYRIVVTSHGYEGNVRAEAAGIIASLFSHGERWQLHLYVEMAGHFHLRYDYAGDRREAGEVFAAID